MSKNIPASMRLQSLQTEPKRLLNEADRLNDELDSLVMDNYRVFVDNLTCSVYLRHEDKKVGELSGDLSKSIHEFSDKCQTFRDRVGGLINAHKRNRKTLKHNMQLVELLELPQLVDACARNCFYDEALELAIFVNGLERKHILAAEVRKKGCNGENSGGGQGIVMSIVDDVHITLAELRRQLLSQLSDDVSLPKLLETLGVLRKLDGILLDRQLEDEKYTNFIPKLHEQEQFQHLRQGLLRRVETALQINFLEARSIWMNKLIRESMAGNDLSVGKNVESTLSNDTMLGPCGKGIHLLEICRSSWYAVVTQFNALFSESMGEYSSKKILSFWVENQVRLLQSELKQLLVCIDEGPSVRSLIEQCFSFSDRMSQVSCDFSCHMIPLFEEVILSRISDTWYRGLATFKTMVETEKCTVEFDDSSAEQDIPLYMNQDDECGDESSETSSTYCGDLMSYPPLAYLFNSFLVGINFYRDCPLLSLRDQVLMTLESIFQDLCDFLNSSRESLQRNGRKYLSKDNQKGAISSDGECSGDSLDRVYAHKVACGIIPHCMNCFRAIFAAKKLMGDEVENDPSDKVDFLSQFDIILKEIEEKSLERLHV